MPAQLKLMTIMTANIEELITINYEIEGLLYLALHRGDETPEQVWKMIEDKIDILKSSIPRSVPDEQVDASNAPQKEEYNEEPLQDEPVAETFKEAVAEEPFQEGPVEETIVVIEEQISVPDITEETPAEQEPEPKPRADIRLDEKLARQHSRDLKKAFSLNDRFRFRRELFANSDSAMNDSLELVEGMQSFDEAADLFYDSLGFDANNPDVVDFMDIIEKHFSSK